MTKFLCQTQFADNEQKKHVDRIRQDYNRDLRSKVMADRQRATAMYFIDKLALRAGNEKGAEEADTVGCCSLRCEHVTLEPPNFVVFDFLGKDSIRFYKRVEVDPQVFKNIRIFKNNKEDTDDLFDRVNVRASFHSSVLLLTGHLLCYIDYTAEQTSNNLHAWSYCEGFPYIQRVYYLPGTTRPAYAQRRCLSSGETKRLQQSKSYGCYSLQSSKECVEEPFCFHGEDER